MLSPAQIRLVSKVTIVLKLLRFGVVCYAAAPSLSKYKVEGGVPSGASLSLPFACFGGQCLAPGSELNCSGGEGGP